MFAFDTCDAPTDNPENDYGEVICSDCEQNAAEAAWERHCEAFYCGDGPLPLLQQQINALKFK